MTRQPEKHMPFFRVVEAFQQSKGCALCDLESKGMHRFFEALLYEYVNDPGVRAQLVRSKGYCNRHAHQLLGFGDGLGTAILYEELVKKFVEYLSNLEGTVPGLLKRIDAGQWRNRSTCPACKAQMEDRARHVEVLAEWFGDEEMKTAFDASPGLCVPHFHMSLDAIRNDGHRKHLVEVQLVKFEALVTDLEEFQRKNDYRFRDEGFGKEADAWLRAVRMLAGAENVF